MQKARESLILFQSLSILLHDRRGESARTPHDDGGDLSMVEVERKDDYNVREYNLYLLT